MFLRISDLKKYYNESEPLIRNLNFSVNRGEIVSFIGESGSGKSVTALTIMRLIRSNAQLKISGNIFYEKTNLLNLEEFNLQKIRAKKYL